MHLTNLLTATGLFAAASVTLLAQVNPAGDDLGVVGAAIALAVLAVRAAHELGKHYLDYKREELHADQLRQQLTHLECEHKLLQVRAGFDPATNTAPAPTPLTGIAGNPDPPHESPPADSLIPEPEHEHDHAHAPAATVLTGQPCEPNRT